MIVKEEYKIRADGVKLFRTYSDEGKYIIQNETGIIYVDAVDVETSSYTYVEYDEQVDHDENVEFEATDGDDGLSVMTQAELTAKIIEMEEQLAAAKVLLGME